MNILLIGGSGLIGSAILGRLLREGHAVTAIARGTERARRRFPEARWQSMDLATMGVTSLWTPLLEDIDAVVNAAGILQSAPGEDLDVIQSRAMKALFSACEIQGIKRVVQISATAADDAGTEFMRTKGEADSFLRATSLDWVILRPGMVLSSAAYGGSSMIRAMASLPWFLPQLLGAGTVRVLSARDVADAAASCLAGEVPPRRTYDLVGDEPLDFSQVLTAYRNSMGLPPGRRLPLPAWLVRPAFLLGDAVSFLGWRPSMRSTALAEIKRGIEGDPLPWREASGHSMTPLDGILRADPPAVQDLWFARMWLLKPVVLAALSLFWFMSGVIALINQADAMEVLIPTAMSTWSMLAVIIGGAFLDILIGLMIAVRRSCRQGLVLSIAVSLGYLCGATIFAPWLWLDPLGPMVKVAPAIVLSLVALAILEDR